MRKELYDKRDELVLSIQAEWMRIQSLLSKYDVGLEGHEQITELIVKICQYYRNLGRINQQIIEDIKSEK